MKRIIVFSLIIFCLVTGLVSSVQAADGVAITVITDLEFGIVYMGSPAQDISPASSRAAQILVETDSNQDLGYEVEVGWFESYLAVKN